MKKYFNRLNHKEKLIAEHYRGKTKLFLNSFIAVMVIFFVLLPSILAYVCYSQFSFGILATFLVFFDSLIIVGYIADDFVLLISKIVVVEPWYFVLKKNLPSKN